MLFCLTTGNIVDPFLVNAAHLYKPLSCNIWFITRTAEHSKLMYTGRQANNHTRQNALLLFCLTTGKIFSSMLATHIYVVTFGLAGLIHRERKWNWPGWYRSIAPCSTIQHPTISYSYIPHRIEHHTKPYHTRPF